MEARTSESSNIGTIWGLCLGIFQTDGSACGHAFAPMAHLPVDKKSTRPPTINTVPIIIGLETAIQWKREQRLEQNVWVIFANEVTGQLGAEPLR